MASPPETPHRRLKDARELSALAHPVRMGIIEHLSVSGPLTATELADRLDETPGQLLLAPAQAGRARVRRGGRRGHRAASGRGACPASASPGTTRRPARSSAGPPRRSARSRWAARSTASPRRAGASPRSRGSGRTPDAGSEYATWLTAAELQEMNDDVVAVLRRHLDRLHGPVAAAARVAAVRVRGVGRPDVPARRGADSRGDRPMKAAFTTPGFTRLYAGLTASMVGDSIMLLVLSMWVKTLTGSNAMAGLTFFFMVIPSLFAPLMGVWLDRVRRKPFLVWGNVASAVMVLPLVLVRDEGDVWIIWSVAFFYGISFVVLPAALNGLLKEMVPEDLLVDANASLQTTKEAFRIFGPLLGAALFALDRRLAGRSRRRGELRGRRRRHRLHPAARGAAPSPTTRTCWPRSSPASGTWWRDRVLANVLVGFGADDARARLLRGLDLRAPRRLREAGDVRRRVRHHPRRRCDRGWAVRGWLIRRTGEVAASAIGLVILALTMLGIAAARRPVVHAGVRGLHGRLVAAAHDRLPHPHPEAHAAGPDGAGLDRGRGRDVGARRGLPGRRRRPSCRCSTTG